MCEKLQQNRIQLYFNDYKFAIKINKNGHSDSNIGYEIK